MQTALSKLKVGEPDLREALWFVAGVLAGAAVFKFYYYYTYIAF